MKAKSLSELLVQQLEDLYDAENQLVKALPKMAEAATDTELKNAFQQHLTQTQNHARRLEQVLESISGNAKKGDCKAMEGLIKEGNEMIKSGSDPDVKDAALITAAQRVEHYEIAGYGTVRTFAQLLGYKQAQDLLEQTLDEEKQTDQKLTEIAEGINVEAAHGEAVGPASTTRPGGKRSVA
jgi:ferritin-like metal-binding protein YciE